MYETRGVPPRHQRIAALFGLPLSLVLVAFGAFLLAGFVKGLIGMGLPTVATGLLTLVMAPGQAAGLLLVPNFATNVWQGLAGQKLPALLRRFWPMLAGICVGSTPGAGFLANDTSGRASMALGVLLAAYALMSMVSPRLSVPKQAEWWLAPVVGAITGFIAILTGVFVLPLVPYLQSLALERDDLIQILGLSFLISALALGVALLREGALPLALIGASVLAVVPAGLGVAVGQWCRQRVSAARFVRIFAVGLLLIGLHLALRGFL
jgi:uncharacterized membrane protein YfcA